MCRIGHSSALCGRISAQRIPALPYKTGDHTNAGKQTQRSPIPMWAPRTTAIRRRTELLAVIL